VYLNGGEIEMEEEESKGQIDNHDDFRVMENFEENPHLTSVLFSQLTPREIVETVNAFLEEYDTKPMLHDKKWKFTYNWLG
jgi:hypothetical protein